MGHRAQRPEPRAHPARRRAAWQPYHQLWGQPRDADLDHLPRPFRVQADCPLGLAGGSAARPLRPARADGRLPQSIPRRLQHGLVPSAGPWTRSHPNSRGERDLEAVTPSSVALAPPARHWRPRLRSATPGGWPTLARPPRSPLSTTSLPFAVHALRDRPKGGTSLLAGYDGTDASARAPRS